MARLRQLRLKDSAANERSGPRFAEFFAGIGLVRMGLEQSGWQVAFANDIDAKTAAAYS